MWQICESRWCSAKFSDKETSETGRWQFQKRLNSRHFCRRIETMHPKKVPKDFYIGAKYVDRIYDKLAHLVSSSYANEYARIARASARMHYAFCNILNQRHNCCSAAPKFKIAYEPHIKQRTMLQVAAAMPTIARRSRCINKHERKAECFNHTKRMMCIQCIHRLRYRHRRRIGLPHCICISLHRYCWLVVNRSATTIINIELKSDRMFHSCSPLKINTLYSRIAML